MTERSSISRPCSLTSWSKRPPIRQTRGIIDDTGACEQTGACEIGDYCYGPGPGGASEQHGGVWVQAFWSVADGRCQVPQERVVSGATSGCPSLIQGRFLNPGNFELVAPLQSGGIAHYSRFNSDPALPWAGPADGF
jgi:hypothetical protein